MSQAKSMMSLSVRSTGAIARCRAVGFNGAQATVEGQKVLGVAEFPATAAGEDVTVTTHGTAIIEAGAAVSVGQTVISDSVGRATPGAALAIATGATAMTSSAANGAGVLIGADTPSWPIGDALTSASAAGQFIEVLLR